MSEETKSPEEESKGDELVEDGFIPLPEVSVEKNEEENLANEGPAEEKPEEKPSEFKLTPVEEKNEEEFEELVHLGQVHRITKEKFKELAQKGFDYDSKVGPHGKIVRLIESNPEIATMVEEAWKAKSQPVESKPVEIKSFDDYDSEDDWLKDNIQIAMKAVAEKSTTQPAQPAQPPTTRAEKESEMLMMRDPQHFNFVSSKFPQYVNRLSIEDYTRIDSDPAALCEFYDYVKEQELGKKKTDSPKPTLKIRSGGGVASKQDGVQRVWDLSNEEFEKQLAAAKGYY